MSALLKVEDTREFTERKGSIIGYCEECESKGRFAGIYRGDDHVEHKVHMIVDNKVVSTETYYLCKCCSEEMDRLDLIAWFGGEFKRGL